MQATLTVLFTDAVASTEALARLGDERFALVQEAHLEMLRAPAAATEGREVKSLGDGLMVAFTGAADALACAVAMQQAIDGEERRGEESLALRVGVSSGDVTVAEDGDLTGTAVVEAARLCAAAAGGQILATETVRVLAGSRGGHVFAPLGAVELKGLGEPVPTVEVGWAPLADGARVAPVPLPARLSFESSWTFVGRTDEVERIEALWEAVRGGGQRVALLGGEPGAGKTRLAREVAVRAYEQGALVLFGRVDEDMAVAYQPFAEALRHYLAGVDEPARDRILGLRGGVLARLVPELVEKQPEGQVEAWAIYEGLVDWLALEAERRPVVLVLDDIHWAAKATLGALRHLVRSDRLGRLLIMGTYRDTELARTHPLAETLADLRREEGVERLAIRGLDGDGVAAFVQAARSDALGEGAHELAQRLSEQTQGNPFFVGQVLRHLAESGAVEQVDERWEGTGSADVFEVPEGVREVVGRRISRLSPLAGELLTVAAVAGPEFDTSIVAQVAGHPIAEALDGFDDTVGSRLVLETDVPGRLRFAHALVRQTLEDELTTLRRVHLHRDLAHAMEARFGAGDSAVAELAHHFAEAAVAGEGERAAHYAERAATQALERGAPGQAIELFERAVGLLPAEADLDGRLRDRLYAQLEYCCWVGAETARLETIARDHLELAAAMDDPLMRCQAVGWLMGSFVYRAIPGPADLALLTASLTNDLRGLDLTGRPRFAFRGSWVPTDASAIRAVTLVGLAFGWSMGVPLGGLGDARHFGDPIALADEALRLAEQSSDPEIVNDVRVIRLTPLLEGPDAELGLHEAEYCVPLGYRIGGGGWVQMSGALARLGRMDDHRVLTDEMLSTAEQNGDRFRTFWALCGQAMEEIVRGRLDQAQTTTERALATDPAYTVFHVPVAYLNVARLLRAGDADGARPIAALLDSSPAIDNSHLVGAVAAAQGDLDTAREVLTSWQAAGCRLPLDLVLAARLWGLAECAHALGDADAARPLYERLAPYRGQMLVHSLALIPASADFALGLLAETLGEHDLALAHLTDALEFEESCGAEALAAGTRDAIARLA